MLDVREYWNFNDPVGSRERFEALLTTVEDSSKRFEIECQIVRTMSLQRQFDQAQAALDRLLKDLHEVDDRANAAYYLERGRTHRSAGEAESAEVAFLEAAKTRDDDYRVDAYHMLALCTSDPSIAEAWNLKALDLSRSSSDFRAQRWRGSLLNNLGWTYHESGKPNLALPLFEEAVNLCEKEGDPERLRVARWAVARCLRSLGRLAEARAIQEELAGLTEDGYVSEELGELGLAEGDPQRAAPHFAKAYKLLGEDPWLVAEQPDRLARLRELSSLA